MSEVTVSARVWVSQRDAFTFPEREVEAVMARPDAALCFSGGGSRAMSASLGYLRGLTKQGLVDRVRYISAVSGGSWATSLFTYYRAGARDDAQFLDLGLDAPTDPGTLSLDALGAELPAGSMASVITSSLRDALFEAIREGGEQNIWNRAVAKIYLEPFGLVDPQKVLAPCLDAATRDAIRARPGNAGVPGLEPDNFIFPRPGRPFLVVNACIVEPDDTRAFAAQNPISLQCTPLYVGSLQPLKIRYAGEPFGDVVLPMGGGAVESFAFGGEGPAQVQSGELSCVPTNPVNIQARQTLEFAVGCSSAAYGAVADELPILDDMRQYTPTLPYWPVREGAVPETRVFDVADGGVLENYGLLAMLQRRVPKAVVFINTNTPIDLDYVPFAEGRHGKVKDKLDVYLVNLFGVEQSSTGTDLQNNTVFTHAAFKALVAALQAKRRAGGPVVVRQRLEVQANDWWGIEGGWSCEIMWVYLARLPQWEAKLPEDTREAIDEGDRAIFKKHLLRNFPHYKTIAENTGTLVELTPAQIRALAAMSEWVIESSADELGEFLG
ncbi:hypothetical protein PPSIR1_36662 [Plesiocystis pacifica SIR-1]|uniref:PNPLA domain-containing protein n=1 Tax=Plesiocystis pacifica SIR-1 TaxID=391625 RepID=A6G1N7_9BACT|nr:patatin-like phospholipase family protein [Plesiocystis pacifica]EDM80301.1 hypothetical protein PPSIR1_36662 [Plesiocystis pacifica SIR-1]